MRCHLSVEYRDALHLDIWSLGEDGEWEREGEGVKGEGGGGEGGKERELEVEGEEEEGKGREGGKGLVHFKM